MVKYKQLRSLNVKKSPKGEILLAEGDAVDGSKQQFTLEKGAVGKEATFGTVRLLEDGKEYLSVTVTIYQQRKAVSLRAKGEGLQIEYTIDLSKADAALKAPVTAMINGEKIRGTFDLRKQKADVDLRLQPLLTTKIKSRVAYFAPTLEEVGVYYRAQEKAAREQPVADAWWNVIARAGCWAAGAAIGAACCAPTALTGAGCVVCAGAAGAAASVCSDYVS